MSSKPAFTRNYRIALCAFACVRALCVFFKKSKRSLISASFYRKKISIIPCAWTLHYIITRNYRIITRNYRIIELFYNYRNACGRSSDGRKGAVQSLS